MSENSKIILHTKEDFEGMRKAGAIVAQVLDEIGEHVKPGVTTKHLSDICHKLTVEKGAVPAALGYKGFPEAVCISVNHVVCHGIPGDKVLQNGDIMNIDAAVIYEGWYGDSGRMYAAGDKVSVQAKRLIKVTYDCMMFGIEKVKPGVKLNEIGKAIQAHAHNNGYSVVRDFCGHGLGKSFHLPPNILHYFDPEDVGIIEPGMFFTVEPMINAGRYGVKILQDGWTAVTQDKSLSAQFEHSIGVTETGFEIFTASPKGLHCI